MKFNTVKKIVLGGVLLQLLFFYFPQSALAQNTQSPQYNSVSSALPQYQGPETSIARFLCTPNLSDTGAGTQDTTKKTPTYGIPISTTASNNPSGGDLGTCINKLYRFGGAIGALAGVFFIALAGYYYIFGGEHGKEMGKEMIISVIAGLVVIFTSYILLAGINPDSIKFKSIQPPILSGVITAFPDCSSLIKLKGVDCQLSTGAVGVSNGSGGAAVVPACAAELVTLDSLNLKSNNGSELICPALGAKLQALKTKGIGIDWVVTATVEPSGHTSNCHSPSKPEKGNCADIGISSNPDPAKDSSKVAVWDKLCAALISVGLSNIANETNATEPNCGTAAVKNTGEYVDSTSAPSLHVSYTGC